MNDRASLLDQLRIDREEPPARGGRRWVAWTGAAVVVAALGAGAWYTWAVPRAVAVGVAVAEPVPIDAPVERGSALDASGYVIARRQATVSSKITGRVVEVLIEEGQQVEEGQVVARLDDANARAQVRLAAAQLEQSEATLAAAEIALANALPTFERNREQLAREIISEQTFDEAKASYDAARTSLDVAARAVDVAAANLSLAERNLDDTVVRAPFAGIVTVKAAQEGEMVSPVSAGGGFTRTGIGTIVDMESLEVEVDVSENFINRVRPGQDVTVRLNAYPDLPIPAAVIAIIPTADRAKATVRVRVGFEEKDPRILPQMGVRVAFLADETASGDAPARTRQAVVVPPQAVAAGGTAGGTNGTANGTAGGAAGGTTGVVFVVDGNTVERRAVLLGARTAAGQIVLSGITAGTRLAIGDLTSLADGARVRIDD